MSLKIDNPNRLTDKQKKFIEELCLDCTQPFPNFKNMTYEQATELIKELIAVKKERIKQFEQDIDPADQDTY